MVISSCSAVMTIDVEWGNGPEMRKGQARDEPGPFNAKGRFDRLVCSGDAELPAFPFTGRRELLGRHELGQIRRLVGTAGARSRSGPA